MTRRDTTSQCNRSDHSKCIDYDNDIKIICDCYCHKKPLNTEKKINAFLRKHNPSCMILEILHTDKQIDLYNKMVKEHNELTLEIIHKYGFKTAQEKEDEKTIS